MILKDIGRPRMFDQGFDILVEGAIWSEGAPPFGGAIYQGTRILTVGKSMLEFRGPSGVGRNVSLERRRHFRGRRGNFKGRPCWIRVGGVLLHPPESANA